MKLRYATYSVLAMLLSCIVFADSAFAQRLGLHVTQQELNIWRQRMTDNVNTINGRTYQTIYTNRILADANSFRSQSHPGGDGFWVGYTGPGCVPSNDQSIRPTNGGTPFDTGNGGWLIRSAFNFLLTGNNTYADPIRTELLSQIAQAGTNWANRSKWCPDPLGGGNVLEIVPWIIRWMHSYDYLLAGGYTGFSQTEKNNIQQWFVDAATLWMDVQIIDIQNSAYPGIVNTPPTYNCVGSQCTTNIAITHLNGWNVRQATYFSFFNQNLGPPVLAMGVGLWTNNSSLIDFAVKYYTAFLKAGVFDDGAVAEYSRWSDCTPPCVGGMWGHVTGPTNGLVAIADMYARSGNLSLYNLSNPTQVLNGNGGVVSLQTVISLFAKLANKTVNYRTGDNLKQLTWGGDGPLNDYYSDFGSQVANLFYNNADVSTAMRRTLARAGTSSSNCFAPQNGGCFMGNVGQWADLPFMYGNMEGKVNPYGGTISPPPPSPTSTLAVTADSTYTGYTTVPIYDGIINAAGGTATTWASADSATADHWINIAFPSPRQLNSATIHWAYNSFQQKYMTSQRVDVQYWNGSSYVTAATITYPGSDIPSSTVSFPAITTSQIRFYQAPNQGNPTYAGVLWITEVDYASKPTPSAPTALQVSVTP